MKYRKKPVTVDVILIEAKYKNYKEIVAFVGDELIYPLGMGETFTFEIRTAEGLMKTRPGYWIIKAPDPKGGFRFWSVDPEYFAENYEAIDK